MAVFLDGGYISDELIMIDAFGWGNWKTTSTFVVKGMYTAIFDPGGRNSAEVILNALKEYKIDLNDIKYIFVTHRHNDHSAGASMLVKKLKNARIYAHPITIENILNPDRINEATISMYGELGEPIEPVKDQDKLVKIEDGDLFDLGNGLVIRSIYMPGHTSDHFMFQEEKNNFVFTGDGAGLFSGKYLTALPNSFPPSFRYEEYRKSLLKLIKIEPDIVGFSHFGSVSGSNVKPVLENSLSILDEWKYIIENDDDYENTIFNRYRDRFDLFSREFREEVLRIIIQGFKRNL